MKISELLAEEKRDRYCSDKCCGSDVKAEDCKCPPTCKHCNCNDPTVSESATAGATSAGSIASIPSVPGAKRKVKKDKNGIPKAPQALNPDGTAKNALDVKDNIMGGKTIKR